MNAYYLLMPRDNLGAARPAPDKVDEVRLLSQSMTRPGRIEGVEPIIWTRDRARPAPDWLWGLPDVPLLSDQFREVIEQYRTPLDDMQWLPMTLLNPDGSPQRRWIPHFPGERDILDIDRTDWGPSGLPIAWVLSPDKMRGISIITRPRHSGSLIVNGDIMRALRRAKLTGFAVMRARVAGTDSSPNDSP